MKSEIDFLNEIINRWDKEIKTYESTRDDYGVELSRLDGIISSRKLARDILLDRLHELKGAQNNDKL